MPLYEVEQYEVHTVKYLAHAKDRAAAIMQVLNGEAELVDGSGEFIEIDEDRGMPLEDEPELYEALQSAGARVRDDFAATIRSVCEVPVVPQASEGA